MSKMRPEGKPMAKRKRKEKKKEKATAKIQNSRTRAGIVSPFLPSSSLIKTACLCDSRGPFSFSVPT
jgi:hypothetical protein